MAPIPPPPPLKTSTNYTESNNKSTTNKANIPNTSALLKSIEKGAKLKKTVTNDRSSPLVSVQAYKSAQNVSSKDSDALRNEPNSSNSSVPALGGLFANGFPTLRSTGNSVKATISPNKEGNLVPKLLKKPTEKVLQNTEIIRDPKKSLAAVQKGSKIAEKLAVPVIITATKGHDVGSIDTSTADLAISGFKEPDKWRFPENIEKMLPVPPKYTGCEKIYLSQTSIVNSKSSKNLSGTLVSNDDIDGFIKNLKSKLSIAESEEKFEECVRLKTKLKSFDVVKKRVQLGERVYASELPR